MSDNYQPLLISFDEAAQIKTALGTDTLLGRTLAAEIAQLERYMAPGIEICGHGEAGGYEHNRHKQNYIHINLAGRLFLITGEQKYGNYVTQMLKGYADVYLSFDLNTSKDTNPPGRIFHQTLNENMWLLYASEAYSCVRHILSPDERSHIEDKLFRPMADLFVTTYAHDFDIVHNHGLWCVAGVGICGYAIGDQDLVNKSLYGLAGDGVKGGFFAQLAQLFSPDGYYMEGPYYHRFALRPLMLFAEAIERRQPEHRIYEFKERVILRTSEAVMKTAFPDGTLPALNDSSKTMDINDEGVMVATSLCFQRYGANPTLIAMAQHQGRVWTSSAGLALSNACASTKVSQFNWGSMQISDGAQGDRGGLGILRKQDAEGNLNMALIWYGQHGSDHKLHAALDHGHFDGLHLSWFTRGQEVIQDYGFGRWVNVEPKFGGRYIPENKSYCKQTIAHNTVVVDETSQNKGDTATAEAKWGQSHFFAPEHPNGQGMSARVSAYYPGVDMQRSVLVLDLPGFEKPLLLDLFRITADAAHQYDYPLHYNGQIIRTDFDYTANATLSPLGSKSGYQHLWDVARGKIAAGGSALVSWLHKNSYYTVISALPAGGEVIFARIGANDPQFNLRNEPALIVRTQGRDQLFATALETHGYFNEAAEASLNARGKIARVEVVGHNAAASVVRLHETSGTVHTVMLSNADKPTAETANEVSFNGETFRWTGTFSVA